MRRRRRRSHLLEVNAPQLGALRARLERIVLSLRGTGAIRVSYDEESAHRALARLMAAKKVSTALLWMNHLGIRLPV